MTTTVTLILEGETLEYEGTTYLIAGVDYDLTYSSAPDGFIGSPFGVYFDSTGGSEPPELLDMVDASDTIPTFGNMLRFQVEPELTRSQGDDGFDPSAYNDSPFDSILITLTGSDDPSVDFPFEYDGDFIVETSSAAFAAVNDFSAPVVRTLYEDENFVKGSFADDTIELADLGFGFPTADAGKGDDDVSGSLSADEIAGQLGDDDINGGRGDDTIRGGRGDDDIAGDEGDDTLQGNRGDDTLLGGEGNDLIHGGRGADELRGGLGDDLIFSGRGRDTITGGEGADSFGFSTQNSGRDTVTDFTDGVDQLVFRYTADPDTGAVVNGLPLISQRGDDTKIKFVDSVIILEDFDASDFTQADYRFFDEA